MIAWLTCPSCQRHVRVQEHACPFCAATLEADFAPSEQPGVVGVGRFEGVALHLGLSTVMTVSALLSPGCKSDDGGDEVVATTEDSSNAGGDEYAGPGPDWDTSFDTTSSDTTGTDSSTETGSTETGTDTDTCGETGTDTAGTETGGCTMDTGTDTTGP
ncbi:MAG: hypothetical protein KC457_28800 [Myxococcales bacterium]|nr:hypothetical protein [Myxococcales bacterium]